MHLTRRKTLRRLCAGLFALALPIALLATSGGASASTGKAATMAKSGKSGVTSSSLGVFTPTFTGPAATGCASGCDLLTGPTVTPSTASFKVGSAKAAAAAKAAMAAAAAAKTAAERYGAKIAATKNPQAKAALARAEAAVADPAGAHAIPDPVLNKIGPDPAPPAVSCQPLGDGCDRISLSADGAKGVKGLKAVDSGTLSTNPNGDIEPADQGLCAGNGYVVEDNNLGEVLFFNTRLQRVSSVIPLDTIMGLTAKGWSSGGDIMCQYDYSNGGHWIFTQFVSASTEASGGPFAGCFAGVANTCFEGIAVTKGSSPFGPYNVYFLNSNYNPAEPGAPFLLNDFTKIAVSRDAFLLFYDEFPLVTAGIGGGFFNGAQEYAIDKNALERGLPVSLPSGKPNPFFNVAIENMGTLPTPDGTCASDNATGAAGVTCWFSVIPAMPPDPGQYDNSHGGSAFMLETLDFFGQGDSRIAVFDWTGLSALDSPGCVFCKALKFGGQLFSGVQPYFYNFAVAGAPQKAGPIPLGDECGAAGLSTGTTPPASCPEGPVATNGDNFTQASQAQGQLWGAISTNVAESFKGSSETHQGAAYWVIGTDSFDRSGVLSFTGQGYVAPAHEDLAFPDIAAGDFGPAALFFTLTGDGGPTGADNGGFFPSTAFGRLFAGSSTLLASKVSVVDLGQSPTDGFSEYQGFPGPTRPRWGDYSAGVYDAGSGKIFFATNYIQYPNCAPPAFTLALATCGGTRDAFANWGTSVNSVAP
jgi:hypothetical protein